MVLGAYEGKNRARRECPGIILRRLMTVSPPFKYLPARALLPLMVALTITLLLAAELHPAGRALAAIPMGVMLIAYTAIVAVLLIAARFARLDWNRLLGPTLPNTEWHLAAVAFPVAVFSYGSVLLLWGVVSLVAPDLVRSAIAALPELTHGNPAQLTVDIVVIVIIAPVVEEILFRGILLHRWAARWGMPAGVILSSTAFAVLHVALIGPFVFALIMSALYVRTRSLWLPIAAHALNNAFVVSLAAPEALRDAPQAQATVEAVQAEWSIGVVAVLIGGAGLYWFWRRYAPRGAWRLPYGIELPTVAPMERPAPAPVEGPIGEAP